MERAVSSTYRSAMPSLRAASAASAGRAGGSRLFNYQPLTTWRKNRTQKAAGFCAGFCCAAFCWELISMPALSKKGRNSRHGHGVGGFVLNSPPPPPPRYLGFWWTTPQRHTKTGKHHNETQLRQSPHHNYITTTPQLNRNHTGLHIKSTRASPGRRPLGWKQRNRAPARRGRPLRPRLGTRTLD